MRPSRPFQTCLFYFYLFFLRKDFMRTKTLTSKNKLTKQKYKRKKNNKGLIFCSRKNFQRIKIACLSLVLLCFCAFCAFFAFCASGIFSQKKINRFEMVLMTSITHTTESKVIPAAPKRLASYFCRPQTVKNSFRRNSVTYGTPCHAISHFVFLLSPCFLQNAMPCHWLSSDLPHVLQI